MRQPLRLRPPKPQQADVILIREHRAAAEFARAVSTIFNPFLTATALFIIVSHAVTRSTLAFWRFSISGLLFFTVAPLIVILYLYVTGRISDFDMSERSERERVFAAFVMLYFAAAVSLSATHAPVQLQAIAWGYWWMAVATMLITRWWKISTHAFGITGPFAAMLLLYKSQPLPYAVVVPLVCWARVYLRSHTYLQVFAGFALAVVSTLAIFKLFHLL
ncbi:MAG: hypothetical protein GIW99_00400 [Candidatus Eremiobacteraeota bacterium]|nr:hypothetical protein [Candidatus Eremiobacteraeota bacterium]MBC5826146.1 hypothetical protein [Candidatus Eremiobacteraeota bacterium]